MILALDGPAASGKGTLARRLAAHFDLPHLDSGLLYRAVGMAIAKAGGDPSDEAAATATARRFTTDWLSDPDLRGDAAARAASQVAAMPGVREALVDFQRAFVGQPGGAVVDGRDIGTVIAPDAEAKLFVTATVEVRADRRFKELLGRGQAAIYPDVLRDLRERDERDSRRSVAPLVPAEDAYVLDTSALDAEQAFEAALAFVVGKTGRR